MDVQIRLAAFNWLQEQIVIHGEILPRKLLENGFLLNGQRITLIGASGIWKPKIMSFPISITTVNNGPYSDSFTNEGFLKYKYRGTDPEHRDNTGLRSLISLQKPLVYFHAVSKGHYLATWPVYIVHDNRNELVFTVAVDDIKILNKEKQVAEDSAYYRRSYLSASILTRVHQRSFRERVLAAYKNQCALCRLKHSELLDAAHIIADNEDTGDPIVQNGLSLCKIHHAAFDQNIIGINPDYQVKVRQDILEEVDGPMLKFGLQSLHNTNLLLPKHKADWPDKERLEHRFSRFRNAC